MTKLHCDECGKELGDYLYGKGGIEERAVILKARTLVSLPDIICNKCWRGETKPLEKKGRI